MTDLTEISGKIDELDIKLTKKNRLALFKEVLIPIVGILLAIMGYSANRDANIRQELEAEAARQQKYLEYFLANYSDASSVRQTAAFALLKYLDPEVRKDLVYGLSGNIELSKETWRVLISLEDVKLNFGIANDYRVEIYYSKEQEEAVRRIEDQLKQAGFEGSIVRGEKIPAFWDTYGWPDGNEMRFDSKRDALATKYLYRFVDSKNPLLRLQETEVDDPSRPNSVAIHLPPAEKPIP